MVASVSSCAQFLNAEFSQGGADAGEKYHRLVSPCTKSITEESSGERAQMVQAWQREGSRSGQQQLLQHLDANLSLAERFFPLQRSETFQLQREKHRWHFRLVQNHGILIECFGLEETSKVT